MPYDFIVLCLILSFFALPILLIRRDLWQSQKSVVLIALPFAFTEPLFYPSYWKPSFLFDLGNRLGFGIEDFLFVGILAFLGSGLWPLLGRYRVEPLPGNSPRSGASAKFLKAVLPLLVLSAAGVLVFVLLDIHALYASYAAMSGCVIYICARRPDLTGHALAGAFVMLVVYWAACILLGALYDGIFREVWQSSRFIGFFMLGVPVEECIYGFLAGAAATVIYPFATGSTYERIASTAK